MDLLKVRKSVRIGAATLAVMMGSGISLASAAGNFDAYNNTTGQSSNAQSNINSTSTRTVDVRNSSGISNTPNVVATTGDNASNGNTGSGTVTGGGVSGTVTIRNRSNFAMGNMGLAPSFGGTTTINSSNSTTGQNSTAGAHVNVNDNSSTNVSNNASTTSFLTGNVRTGHSSANGNTGSGTVSSGTANVGLDVSTDNNANAGAALAGLNGAAPTMVNATVGNDHTGQNSSANASANISSNQSVTENNTSTINNGANLVVDTGSNSASGNTGGGTVNAGGAGFTINFDNSAN